ncbi:hypothetical protein AV935_11575 [Levilactobacillus brevis]|uniref:restriction endonuclease subunit S n=1 Tax=Levilactobacillus brevis TaxID=1580 RepID=UPI0007613365|nr:restriction endonuclease subunit S [Levilactobacillus brevis]KWU39343.1 hypothetical protein AV935_11575 [Levilactobacillus brevis]
MKDNQAKYPQLRFKCFTDPWEQRKLEKLVDVRSGHDYKHLNRGNIPVYGTGGYMLSVDKALSENEDAIGIGRKGTIDNPFLLKAPFWTVDTLFYVVPRVDYNLNFVNSIFQKINWKKYDESTGVPSLSKSTINSVIISFPSYEEQKQIGTFFQQLDKTIALHQRKLTKLKELKQGYLQKMFPKNGSKFPQLRFAGFADAWEQRKLGDLGDILRKSIDPQLTPSREFVEYSMPSYDRGKRPNRVLGESMQSTRLKISGTVLLINKLNVRQRRIWFVKKAPENAVASGEFVPFQSFEIDLGFLHQLFLSDKTTSELQSISSGTSNSQKRVTPSDLLHYPICIPTTKGEQVVVGRFLSSIDNLITLHQRKLEKLQELKKGYLQKMFC